MKKKNRSTLSFLKKNVPSDELTINRLFVSSFISINNLTKPTSTHLSQYIIYKDDIDYELLQIVQEHIRTEYGEKMTLETVVKLFEFVVSPADRIVTGAVYTPQNVRKTILNQCLNSQTGEELDSIRIADISCGCGGFLIDVALWIHERTGKSFKSIIRENIYGIDIQEYAIERTKILLSLLSLLYGEDENLIFNLLCRDTLDYSNKDWDTSFKNFDVIIGNPPYVCSRNLSTETYKKMRNFVVCSSGHPDLYIPFFQIAIEMLNKDGRLGFITMNTFIRSVNGRALRSFFSHKLFEIKIVDFRGFQVFESKNTYTCLFYLDKLKKTSSINYAVAENGLLSTEFKYNTVKYTDLDDKKGWALNKFNETLAIESIGIQIKDFCPSRHGIATLSNKTYIFSPSKENDKYYYLTDKEGVFPIEKEICRNIINPNRLNSINEFEVLLEKVIFPYYLEDGHAIIYTPNEMSCRFPMALNYLRTKKRILLRRDKDGTSSYPQWYAYGRTQSLNLPKYKLFFPKFANKPLRCIMSNDPSLMLYNGMAFVNNDERKLKILKIIIESELFWNYIRTNGKPYASGYYSLSGVDIKHFSIPNFTREEENELLSFNNYNNIENWLSVRYNICAQ